MDEQPDEVDKEALIARADSAYVQPPTFAEFMQTADVDLGPWERALAELEQARAEAPPDADAGSVTYLLRAAAVETGAIEDLYTTDRGFTFNVAADVLAIEQLAVEKGEDFVRLFDAQLASFEMALDAATNAVPLSESWLRQLHEVTTAGQETYRVHTAHGVDERPLPRGTYKTDPNHVLLKGGGTHSYAPVAETAREVRRVIEQIRSDEFIAADPIHQAAYAHHALVAVHPFSDGNGRVVRALASVFLLRAASVPLLIYSDQTAEYFDALALSDRGDHASFTRFVRDRVISVARQAATALRRGTVDRNAIDDVLKAYFSPLGVRYEELDADADRVVRRLYEHLTDSFAQAALPSQFTTNLTVNQGPAGATIPLSSGNGWRVKTNRAAYFVRAAVSTPSPAKASASWDGGVLITTGVDAVEAFRLVGRDMPDLLIGLGEVAPEITHELDRRLSDLADSVVSRLIAQVAEEVRSAIEQRGY